MGWRVLGKGGYNNVYINDDRTRVFKVNQDPDEKTDTPERSRDLWNKFHPTLSQAEISEEQLPGEFIPVRGWSCPFIEGRQSNDAEMSTALIDIFNRVDGRIVTDAPSTRNFITTSKGEVVCIDIGMAMQLEQREDELFDAASRRQSVVSLEKWKAVQGEYHPYFEAYIKIYPNTVNVIKALLFIKTNRPDIFDVEFLKKNKKLVKSLAAAYDSDQLQDMNIHYERKKKRTLDDLQKADGQSLLLQNRPITLENIQASCVNQLKQYIQSRGELTTDQKFKPSIQTFFLRKSSVINHKIAQTQAAIKKINGATSIEQIKEIIESCQQDPKLMKPGKVFSSNIASRLGSCLLIVEIAQKSGLKLGRHPTESKNSLSM